MYLSPGFLGFVNARFPKALDAWFFQDLCESQFVLWWFISGFLWSNYVKSILVWWRQYACLRLQIKIDSSLSMYHSKIKQRMLSSPPNSKVTICRSFPREPRAFPICSLIFFNHKVNPKKTSKSWNPNHISHNSSGSNSPKLHVRPIRTCSGEDHVTPLQRRQLAGLGVCLSQGHPGVFRSPSEVTQTKKKR